MKVFLAIAIAALVSSHSAIAATESEQAARTELGVRIDPAVSSAVMRSDGFLHYHPDIAYRIKGVTAREKGDRNGAITAFKHSARYADKASAAALSELLWEQGSKAEAYAWMDLAAERGYRALVIRREQYWNALSKDEQAAAIELGTAIYAEYGDDVAKPRLAAKLNKGRRDTTGSHAGTAAGLKIQVAGPGGGDIVDAETYYAPHWWVPEAYFASKDAEWTSAKGDAALVSKP